MVRVMTQDTTVLGIDASIGATMSPVIGAQAAGPDVPAAGVQSLDRTPQAAVPQMARASQA